MKLSACVECGNTHLIDIMDSMEIEENNKIFVVQNIPSQKCTKCNEIYHNAEAARYIDKQIEIFKAEGFENKAKEITKQKGLTQEQLGQLLGGLTKQRVNQILNSDNLDVKTMYKIANAVNEPIQNIFNFKRIIEKDHKFYIEN